VKLILGVLVVLVILFAIGTGLGFRKEDDSKVQQKKAEDGDTPAWTQKLDKLGSSVIPRVEIPKGRLVISPGASFRIQKSDSPFRLLKLFYDKGGRVRVEFVPDPPESGDQRPEPQVFILAGVEKREIHPQWRRESTIVVFESGGTLTLRIDSEPGNPIPGTVRAE